MTDRGVQAQKIFTEGAGLLRSGNVAEALARFMSVRKIDPKSVIACLYAGTALHELGRYNDAIDTYRQAIILAPHIGEIHNNLGNSLMALGRFDEAAENFIRSSEILVSSPVPLTAQATALQALGRISEAETACRQALALEPFFAAAHWNLALNLLLQGRYAEGWQEYEWRWRRPDFTSPCRHTDVRLWDGSALHGDTIVLHAEQGFGDAIQFVRYAPLVAQRGGNVIIECHPQLVSLLQTVAGIQTAVPFGAPLPAFNSQSPLLSLPRIFGTTLQSIPDRFPYVSATADYRKKWTPIVPDHTSALRVGLVWSGKKYPDPLRSCQLSELAPLAAHDIIFYSLQLGEDSEQAGLSISGMELIDKTEEINDFADTAALIEQLDLVICIDTAVAHLAGALGKPTWLMLPFAPDWRWLVERCDSPWYPTMRIFRQNRPGVWGTVIVQVIAALDLLKRYKKSFDV